MNGFPKVKLRRAGAFGGSFRGDLDVLHGDNPLIHLFALSKTEDVHTPGVLALAGMNGTPTGDIQFNHVPFFKAR